MTAMLGASAIAGFDASASSFVTTGNWFVDLLVLVGNNVSIFFSLMSVSSEYALFNGIILAAYSLSMVWAVLELARGV